jgi:hypothetical protein
MDARDERPAEMDETTGRAPARRPPPKDNRSLFIEAMADPTRRRIAFDVVERNCRMRFRVGEEGVRVYLQLLTFVQSSKVDDAVDEIERRFVPMLDRRILKRMIGEDGHTPT